MARAYLAALAALLLTASCNTTPPEAQSVASGGRDLAVTRATATCESLAAVDLTAIGGAGSKVTAAKATQESGVNYCTVDAMLAPTIGLQVRLPTDTWTQRYLQTGCGGLCGNINLRVGAAEGCAVLNAGGFVVASTDMGHQGGGGTFGADPQKRIDFAYRGVHLTAVAAKALIRAYYGKAQAYSYFTGCSDGGREALMEVQRYPGDFDGVIAGAPAMNFNVQNSFYHAWQARSNTGADGRAIIVADRLPILHKAVVAACDKIDGLEDGLIADPRQCKFDPATAQCAAGQDSAACLTAAEVDAARKLYAGPRDEAGVPLTLGGPQPGSELSWAGVFVPRSAADVPFSQRIVLDALRGVIFETNPPESYGINDFAFDRATFTRATALHGLYGATDPDISRFASGGRKLILWHGWSDQHISPLNTIAYYEAVQGQLGAARAAEFTRLYLFPGMYHCGGGEGPAAMDMLTPMMAWVERGVAPDAIIARQTPPAPPPGAAPSGGRPATGPTAETPAAVGATLATRPVYPYPKVAAYRGQGVVSDAASFAPRDGVASAPYQWVGADLFKPGRRLDCTAQGGALSCAPSR